MGVLYWFSLIKNISESTGDKDASQNKSLAILSGFLFGLASWTRPEFVIYSAVPLFLLVCVCDQKRETFYGRNTVIGRFAISALVLPTAWFLVLLNFDGPLDGTFKQLILVCAGLWIGVGLALSGAVKLTPRVFTAVCVVAIATGLVALFIILPEDISPWTVLTVRLFRLFAVHVFFAGTVFLGVFLFSERLRQLSLAEKTLGALLLLFLLTQFFIYAYAGLKWPTLTDFVYNTFIHPGNSINLSDTRGTIAFYPAFVFFIFCIPRIRFDIESASVRRIVLAIVAVNLTILILVFAGPRIKFVAENWDKSYEQLAETSGPPDLPNQFVKTYQVAHQLKDKGSRIKSLFLPPGNREGSIRSVMTQVLFGANLTFEDDPDYWTNLKNAGSSAYVVSRSEGKDKICHGRKGEVLGDTGFVVCRLGKSQVKSLEPLSDF